MPDLPLTRGQLERFAVIETDGIQVKEAAVFFARPNRMMPVGQHLEFVDNIHPIRIRFPKDSGVVPGAGIEANEFELVLNPVEPLDEKIPAVTTPLDARDDVTPLGVSDAEPMGGASGRRQYTESNGRIRRTGGGITLRFGQSSCREQEVGVGVQEFAADV